MPKRIDKLTGLITHQDDNGLLYVFVPGKHPDLVIDQRKTLNDEQCFHIGDFISFINVNDSITSPTRIKNLFETRFVNNRLQVKVLVAFPPGQLSERANFTTFTNKMLAWSPDFAFIGCSFDVVKKLRENQMYSAWIERVPQMIESIAGIFVSWQIVDDIFDECCEQSKQLIMKAPWNHKKNTRLSRILSYSDCSQQMKQKASHSSRHFFASLKKYTDNYEGLVIAVHDSSAKVWSLAIPDSEIVFFLGARKGMKVGDWVQFNCTPSRCPYLNCHLQGKKFEIIEPVLPAKAFNNTVQVEITTTIAIDNLKYYPTGEVTLETEILGPVEFSPNRFRQDYCNRCLSLFICKIIASERTDAVWHVFSVINEGCVEFMEHSDSISNFSNTNVNTSEEFASMENDKCNAKVEINDNYCFTESRQQRSDFPSDLPGTFQKEIDDSFYSDFSYNNDDMKEEEEYDPLKEPAFGTVKPNVLQFNSTKYSNGSDEFDMRGNSSTGLNEKSFEVSESEELNNRATKYWLQAWKIPEIRRQIEKADRIMAIRTLCIMKFCTITVVYFNFYEIT
uniref:p-granule-associated protein DEPS-1 second OB-fold domain-containing protein n=1 Tax=Wuchereria bancrofti TaxID=6293 RepID=A0AAF5Q5Y6_WUCBA